LLPDDYLLSQIKKITKKLGIKKIEEKKRFNHHEFWLEKNKEGIRIEFVFYPFPNIRKSRKLSEINSTPFLRDPSQKIFLMSIAFCRNKKSNFF